MAVTRLMRFAFTRPHLFIACAPGGAAARLTVERFAREHGWPLAASPADADLLVVCGTPSGRLAEAVDVVWGQVPTPRVRLTVTEPADGAAVLHDARTALLQPDAWTVTGPHPPGAHHEQAEPEGRSQHDGHSEHGELGGHGGHHDHMGMEVAGLAMADRGPDRDGLRLDELGVSLGPFLPAWPAGMWLNLKLQGDVAQEVTVEAEPAVDVDASLFAGDAHRVAAGRLDALGSLLEVTGADGPALRARHLRDRLVAGEQVDRALRSFAKRLRRSRLLRAATDGVADLHGLDATARWQLWLAEAQQVLDGEPVGNLAWPLTPDELGELLTGLELGGLRIAVASLVPPIGLPAAAVGSAVHSHG